MLCQLNLSDTEPFLTSNLDTKGDGIVFLDDMHGSALAGDAVLRGFMLVCFCREGKASLCVHGRPCELRPGDVLVCFGQQSIAQCICSSDFSAQAAIVSQDVVGERLVGWQHGWPFLIYLLNNPVISLSEGEQRRLQDSFALLSNRMDMASHHYRRDMSLTLLRLCYLDVCNFLADRVPVDMLIPSRNHATFDAFMRCLQQNYRRYRDVGWYARQLSLTPKYLSEVVKQVSGCTAGDWINAFVMNELKTMLRGTSLSIKEIAIRMNFANQSFLGKYFKSTMGMSPAAYRKEVIR